MNLKKKQTFSFLKNSSKISQLNEPLSPDSGVPQYSPRKNNLDSDQITEALKLSIKQSVQKQQNFIDSIKNQGIYQNKVKKESSVKIEDSQKVNFDKYVSPQQTMQKRIEQLNHLKEEVARSKDNMSFADMKQQFQNYTETQIPFLQQQVQDVMYLNKGVIISLQYNFYQSGVKTTLMKCIEKHENNNIGTESYQLENKRNDMSHFNMPVHMLKDSGELYHDYQCKQGIGKLMEAQNTINLKEKDFEHHNIKVKQLAIKQIENDYSHVEGSLCVWRADEKSKLFPDREVYFSMELPYLSTKEGRMQVSVSSDQKVISLLYFNPDLQNFNSNCQMDYDIHQPHFKILSWKLNKNYHFEENTPRTYEKLCSGIENYYQENPIIKHICSSRFYSSYKYFMLEVCTNIFHTQIKKLKQLVTKFLIFDSESGELVIQLDDQFVIQFKQTNNTSPPLHTLGVQLMDIPTTSQNFDYHSNESNPLSQDEYTNEIAIFYGGPLLESKNKKYKKDKKQGLGFSYISIKLEDLQNIRQYDQNINLSYRLQYIIDQVQQHSQTLSRKENKIFNLNTEIYEDWFRDISICINKDFKFISLSFIPKIFNDCVSGKKLLIYSNKDKTILHETPFTKEQVLHHCRNSHIKQDIMYILESQIDGFQGYCITIQKNGEIQTGNIKINTNETDISKLDITEYMEEEEQDDIFGNFKKEITFKKIMQLVAVTNLENQISLTTRIPLSYVDRKGDDFKIIHKFSARCHQISASYPIICRNLNLHQLSIQNIMESKNPKQYIIELHKDEFFLTFVEFNSYEDIGFYPEYLNVQCCINILFLTRNKDQIRMNLLLVDPYFNNIQVGLFKSSYIIPFNDFNEDDIIIKSIVCPTRKHSGKERYQIYIITQYEATLNRSMFIENIESNSVKVDSELDELEGEKSNTSDFFDGESDNDSKPSLENVEMLVDKNNFIYYMTKTQGVCRIMEVYPQDSGITHHAKIAEVKAEYCLSFSIVGMKFYVMDELNTIHILSRMNNSRELKFNYELNIKEVSRPEIVYKDFKMNIMNDNYYIQGSSIYYLYGDDPYDDGIMESESLIGKEEDDSIETKFTYLGPIRFTGSDLFICIYRVSEFKCILSTYMLPDSQQCTIFNDFQNSADMSTFIDHGQILLKCTDRYMIFDNNGVFQSQVKFDETCQELTLDEIQKLFAYNICNCIKSHKTDSEKVSHSG